MPIKSRQNVTVYGKPFCHTLWRFHLTAVGCTQRVTSPPTEESRLLWLPRTLLLHLVKPGTRRREIGINIFKLASIVTCIIIIKFQKCLNNLQHFTKLWISKQFCCFKKKKQKRTTRAYAVSGAQNCLSLFFVLFQVKFSFVETL